MSMQIIAPGFYDIPEADYHADPVKEPSLSNSIAKVMVNESPLHAWGEHSRLNPHYQATHKSAFDLGSTCHGLLLDQEDNYCPIDHPDWRTKDAKEQREQAHDSGRIPLLKKDFDRAREMADSARRQLKYHEDAACFLMNTCHSERTMVWQEQNGVWCRSRIDRMTAKSSIVFDYKTTAQGAHPDKWGGRTLYDHGCDMQDAFYSRGIKTLTGVEPAFLFVVQETTPPYALSVISMTPVGKAIGNVKVERAIAMWDWCTKHNKWPGYPNKTAYVDPPIWQQREWIDEGGEGTSTSHEETKSIFRSWEKAQAPINENKEAS